MSHDKRTTLVAVRAPTPEEKKHGAEIVFEREEKSNGFKHVILACRCYESWEQWGAQRYALSDNVDAVERWRHHGGLEAFDEEPELL